MSGMPTPRKNKAMDFENKIKELSSQIKDLDDQSANLASKSYELRQEREQLIAQMILENKMLKGTNWSLYLDGSNGVVLNYQTNQASNSMDFISKMAQTDYSSWFELSDGIYLRFDDDDISISFKEAKQLVPFVKKHVLIVSGSGVTDRLAKLKRDVAALEAVIHQFSAVL